jgi:Macrocin-O-methyltransferase (TylF)
MTPTDLYLDLLTKSLTGTILGTEPDTEQGNELRFVQQFVKHYIRGDAISMLPVVRFDNLRSCIATVLADKVPGDFIETGVWRGGATIFMRAMLRVHDVTDRTVWVADSFEGLPVPDADKFPLEAKAVSGPMMKTQMNNLAASLEDVQANFKAYGMLDGQVRFLKGWFRDTLPTAPIQRLAILRLDGDLYESTMDGLTNLYDKVSPGGFVIVDDYGEEMWTYCAKAVDEFRAARGIKTPLVRVDSRCWFWRKE